VGSVTLALSFDLQGSATKFRLILSQLSSVAMCMMVLLFALEVYRGDCMVASHTMSTGECVPMPPFCLAQ